MPRPYEPDALGLGLTLDAIPISLVTGCSQDKSCHALDFRIIGVLIHDVQSGLRNLKRL